MAGKIVGLLDVPARTNSGTESGMQKFHPGGRANTKEELPWNLMTLNIPVSLSRLWRK